MVIPKLSAIFQQLVEFLASNKIPVGTDACNQYDVLKNGILYSVEVCVQVVSTFTI